MENGKSYMKNVNNPTIKKILEKYKEISLLGKINALLGWDLNVNLPMQGSAFRSEGSAYIAELTTDKWLDKEFRNLLEKANGERDLTMEEKGIVRNLNFAAKFYYKVPKSLIVENEKVTSGAFIDWRSAKEDNNFKGFEPHLTKIVEIDRQIAQHLGYKDNPYDALLNLYEPELTAAECSRLFNGVKQELVPFIKKITKSKGYSDNVEFIKGQMHYPKVDQEKILNYTVEKMGFDFSRGRLDISAHPFTTALGPNDIRTTTFYSKTDFRDSFTSSVHETGHALYELGINPEFASTPLEGGVSLGVHEGMSRFWENMVGKNPNFLRFMTPIFKSFYDKQLLGVDTDGLIKAFNLVKPSLIRIYADEVTYSLHIILRFEMENEIINGKISVKDAPVVWREKAKKLLGVEPKTDCEGILQDVHWAYGNFGYFPSYAMGNLYGAQILSVMQKKVNFDFELAHGNLLPIKNWLDENLHHYGSMYFPQELIKQITGKALDYKYFTNYIIKKYSELYNLTD